MIFDVQMVTVFKAAISVIMRMTVMTKVMKKDVHVCTVIIKSFQFNRSFQPC